MTDCLISVYLSQNKLLQGLCYHFRKGYEYLEKKTLFWAPICFAISITIWIITAYRYFDAPEAWLVQYGLIFFAGIIVFATFSFIIYVSILKKLIALLVVIALLFFASLAVGIPAQLTNHAYLFGNFNTIKVNRGISHFSFEYPSRYTVNTIMPNRDGTLVILEKDKEQNENIGRKIEIQTGLWANFNLDLTSEAGRLAELNRLYQDIEIITQNQLTVSRKPADQITYYYKGIAAKPSVFEPLEGYNYPAYGSTVYVNQAEHIWEINLESDRTTSELGKIEFEHVVNSFYLP